MAKSVKLNPDEIRVVYLKPGESKPIHYVGVFESETDDLLTIAIRVRDGKPVDGYRSFHKNQIEYVRNSAGKFVATDDTNR